MGARLLLRWMVDQAKVKAFVADCRRHVAGELRDDLYTRVLYSTDASLYQVMPHAVVIPRTIEDVIAAVALAAEYGLPVLPRGAGTSLAGQAVNEALIIDFTRHLDAIVEINPDERWVRVQPGVVVDDLNASLRPHSLQFGPDPASSDRSTVGGMVANNATGSHSLLYGMTADHVQAMEVVLADGSRLALPPSANPTGGNIRVVTGIKELIADSANRQIIREGTPHYWRRCGGYNLDRLMTSDTPNLAQLVCGSEGTLAVMTEITLGLVPRPAHTGLALVHFDDLPTALAAVPAMLETQPAAVELIDHLSLTLCRDVLAYARLLASVVDGHPYCLLVVEFQGDDEAAVADGIQQLEERLRRGRLGASHVTRALTPEAQRAVWGVRKAGLGLLMSMKGDVKPVPFIEDAAVPVAHLSTYVSQIEAYCAELGTPVTYYAHAGAGCLHIRPLINRRRAAEVARLPDIARFAAGLVHGYGGAISSEHGDGRARSWLNESFYGPQLYDLFRQVKRIFDPQNRLNPGIIVEAASMTEAMRALPEAPDESRVWFGDYERIDGQILRIAKQGNTHSQSTTAGPGGSNPASSAPASGFVRAVEMCNGAGVCRRLTTGTMCPSFMVTRDEEHSTRGRANALRAALSGVLPAAELTSPRMAATMDLCISCKACKAECPSAVDMARLKSAFLVRYYAVHGVPLRARFFGHAATLNRLGSGRMAPATNAVLRSRLGRRLAARVLGLAPERPLPLLAREPFAAWWGRRSSAPALPDGEAVMLLIDPFTNYNHPEVGIAAVEFLTAVGVAVVAALCADDGRALISKGLMGAARRTAAQVVDALTPAAEQGLLIVGLEPSGLLTLRDEYFHLLPDDPRVALVAGQARTFEEYVDELAARLDLLPYFNAVPRRVLLHGHCHQKALVGTGPARRALSLPPGYTVEEVDSGCCGMAGSFGYEAEHYAISMQMGERRLLPAVRAAATGTIIAAAGVSCREQIAQGSGRTALHPAQILRDALRQDFRG
ncbi:MAG: FAD-binding protein [Candidatus Promineofilum sp.]|uniref:FAD-binding and (Fe-S)-binding domain-containing protein n=1 Tax=Promineifilum sp. TaxID=2664178 RepID=UPI0024120B5A|nr:FAD-binding protein [Promineifilum sp.]